MTNVDQSAETPEAPRELTLEKRETALALRDALFLAKDGNNRLAKDMWEKAPSRLELGIPHQVPHITRSLEFLARGGFFNQTEYEVLDSPEPVTVTLSERGKDMLAQLEEILGTATAAA